MQFNCNGLHSGQYAIAVSAGKKRFTADAVNGEKFTKGGVAMKVEVGTGAKIAGRSCLPGAQESRGWFGFRNN